MISNPYDVKQALEAMVDFVYEHQNDPPPPPEPPKHPAHSAIEMPKQLASQVLITGDATSVFIDFQESHTEHVFSGTMIIPTIETRFLTIVTNEARWQWDWVTHRWFITGIDPDFFYELRGALEK
jgi:hypothetical protein